ncbi:hypothetical protein EV421DRAFT_1863805 [Armillaria borealis]|uniref:Uncharacterized protein n=1 Tax=Armillaria borealis TaxID=47425 RepID=A0AA39IU87_9AGAR|nr:hypothetical protein EV421DRAFT_1863805 [Armillaria borealis]
MSAIPSILISFLTTERSSACLGIWRNEEMGEWSLDWTPCYPQTNKHLLDEPKFEVPREREPGNDNGGDGLGEDTYFAMDIDMLERQGERDKNFILLLANGARKILLALDSGTPLITEALHE